MFKLLKFVLNIPLSNLRDTIQFEYVVHKSHMPKHNTESNKEATNSPLLCTLKDGQVPGVLFPYVIGRASHSMQNNTFGTRLKRVSHGAKQ